MYCYDKETGEMYDKFSTTVINCSDGNQEMVLYKKILNDGKFYVMEKNEFYNKFRMEEKNGNSGL